MLFRLLTPLLSALALLAVPAAAQGAFTVGIAENDPRMFSDPLFTQLGAKQSRVVVSWNVATARNDEINRVISYLAAAQASGVRPLVTFEHARGDATICRRRSNRRKAQCRLPSAKAYEKNLRAFKALFPTVRDVVAWNEINHFTQPTYKNPKAAARFTQIARKVFRGGTVVAADILDQANQEADRLVSESALMAETKRRGEEILRRAEEEQQRTQGEVDVFIMQQVQLVEDAVHRGTAVIQEAADDTLEAIHELKNQVTQQR